MVDAPLAAAFTAGMIATVNPCGFVMLPAYLGYFLGIGTGDGDRADAPLGRALLVGAVVSAGFLSLFAVAGALVSWTTVTVAKYSPWLTVGIGVALTAGGIAFLAGWEPKLAVPRLDKGGRTRGLGSMFLFGVSYAVASLSCTIGPFVTVVATTFSRTSVAAGVASFVAYGLDMALLLMMLTVTLAMARQGLLTWLRRAMPFIMRISGAIMLLAGAYLTWYGIYEIRLVLRGEVGASQGPVGTVTGWSTDLQNWLDGFEPLQVVLVFGLVVGVVALVALLRTPPSASPPADEPPVREPSG